MKKISIAFLFICLFAQGLSLSSCNTSGRFGFGCVSGIVQGTNLRVYIACMSRSEYLQSDNVFFGQAYDNLLFTELDNDDCQECSSIDYSQLQ